MIDRSVMLGRDRDMSKELLTAREAVRLDLVRRAVHDGDTLERAYLHAVKLSAEALQVTRVGVWLFAADMQSIRCVVQYDLRHGSVTPRDEIDLRLCPEYARALATRRAVAADDALADPRTCELSAYFQAHGISSLLDTPVFRQGEPVALLCHEQVGPGRVWSATDKHFAASVSDMLGMYLEQHAAQAHYEELLRTRRALEEHRVMESLGRMATAVAHDMNNLLLAVGLKAELLARAEGPPSQRQVLLSDLLSIVDQGARLVRQLLEVGRRDTPSNEVTDLGLTVREMEPLLRTHERGGVRLVVRLPASPAKVRIERSRFEQVVMNLVINARDAMLGGGTLTVEILLNDGPGREAAREVLLVVSDTGVGMSAELRERIFEPFYTTKAEGQGHGLGLSTVYGIVLSTEGKIGVESQLGAGSRFTVAWAEARTE